MPVRIPTHRPAHVPSRAEYEASAARKADKTFYASAPWRKFRAVYLQSHPLCMMCLAEGRYVPAEHVHHVEARKADPGRVFDEANMQALCHPHHTGLERRGAHHV